MSVCVCVCVPSQLCYAMLCSEFDFWRAFIKLPSTVFHITENNLYREGGGSTASFTTFLIYYTVCTTVHLAVLCCDCVCPIILSHPTLHVIDG